MTNFNTTRLIVMFALSFAVVAGMGITAEIPTDPNTIVIVVGNGKKYHASDCRYAQSDNAKELALKDAKGKDPCALCWKSEADKKATAEKKVAGNSLMEKLAMLEKKIAELTEKVEALQAENVALKKAEN